MPGFREKKTPLTDCVATYAPPLLSHRPYWHPTFKLPLPLINLLKRHTGIPILPLHPPMNVCWFLTLTTQKSDNCTLLLSRACFQGGGHLGCLLTSYFPSGRPQAGGHNISVVQPSTTWFWLLIAMLSLLFDSPSYNRKIYITFVAGNKLLRIFSFKAQVLNLSGRPHCKIKYATGATVFKYLYHKQQRTEHYSKTSLTYFINVKLLAAFALQEK
jgi:hypothetical protein